MTSIFAFSRCDYTEDIFFISDDDSSRKIFSCNSTLQWRDEGTIVAKLMPDPWTKDIFRVYEGNNRSMIYNFISKFKGPGIPRQSLCLGTDQAGRCLTPVIVIFVVKYWLWHFDSNLVKRLSVTFHWSDSQSNDDKTYNETKCLSMFITRGS